MQHDTELLDVAQRVDQLKACAAELQHKYRHRLIEAFMKSAVLCISGFLEQPIVCIMNLPSLLTAMVHCTDGHISHSTIAVHQSTLIELLHVVRMVLVLPTSWWVVDDPRGRTVGDGSKPQIHKCKSKALLVAYFNARLAKCTTWIRGRTDTSRKWYVPCPFPPAFSEEEQRLLTALAARIGLRGMFAKHGSMFEEANQPCGDPPRKRQREEVDAQPGYAQHARGNARGAPIPPPPRYSATGNPPTLDAASQHLWRRFAQSWNWQSCVLWGHSDRGVGSMADAVRNGMTNNDRALCTVAAFDPPRMAAVVVSKDVLGRHWGQFACSATPGGRIEARDQLVAVSPAQHRYMACSGVCVDGMRTFRERGENVSSQSLTTAQGWEALMPSGWSYQWSPLFGCYALLNHIGREAFLDAVFGSRAHNVVAARMASLTDGCSAREEGPGRCDTSTQLVAEAPSIGEAHPLLRKVLQHCTKRELGELTTTATTASADGGAAPPPRTAAELYREAICSLGRRLTVPQSAFASPEPEPSLDGRGAGMMDVPVGQAEDDGWVVDHVQRIAVDGKVPLCVAPWSASLAAGGGTTSPVVAVVVDPRGLNWNERICAQPLDATRARAISSASAEGIACLANQELVPLPATVSALLGAMDGLPEAPARWTVGGLQQQYETAMCAARRDLDIGLRLGCSTTDSAWFSRWRHASGHAVGVTVVGALVDDNCMALVVGSMHMQNPLDAAKAEPLDAVPQEEIAPYCLIPIAVNGSLASCEACHGYVGQELGHLVADWLSGPTAWEDIVSYGQTQFLGTYHGVVFPFAEALRLVGRIELR